MTDFITPVYISSGESPKCPKCGGKEDIKRTCRNCGYEYANSKVGVWEVLLVCLICVIILWVIGTLGVWIIMGDQPLTEILKEQWEHISHLKL